MSILPNIKPSDYMTTEYQRSYNNITYLIDFAIEVYI